MGGDQAKGRVWHELARCAAPLGGRDLWRALLDKTEYPQHYAEHVRDAEVIDHDARTVVRRLWFQDADPCIEWVRHEVRNRRVECSRQGQDFRRAQALVETVDGRVLVYQVDDPEAAQAEAGIDARYAGRVLQRIIDRAQLLLAPPH